MKRKSVRRNDVRYSQRMRNYSRVDRERVAVIIKIIRVIRRIRGDTRRRIDTGLSIPRERECRLNETRGAAS